MKWASERGEALVAWGRGETNLTTGELAIDKDGKFLALRTRNLANMGAYLSTFHLHPDARRRRRAVRRVQLQADLCERHRRVHAHGSGGRLTATFIRRAITCWRTTWSMPRLRELNIDRAELRTRDIGAVMGDTACDTSRP